MAITVHEASHGYAAYLLGDKTAKEAGRLTLNPFKHIDPL
jgi:Zn-dependent protease